MLTTLCPTNWKSFGSKEAQVISFGPVTLLVGPNASGKSNVIDALRLLQGAALDLPIYEALRGRWEGGREVWPGIRGGEAEAAHSGSPTFTLHTFWRTEENELDHFLVIKTGKEIEVHSES